MNTNELSEVDGGPMTNRTSIFFHIEQGLKKNPNGLVSIIAHQPANHLIELIDRTSTTNQEVTDCLAWTYTELHTAALKFAQALIANGVQPDMKVVTLIPNGIEFPITLWMSTILRLTLCPLDPSAASNPSRQSELLTLLRQTSPDIILVNDLSSAQAIDQALEAINLPPLKSKILLNSPPSPSSLPPQWTTLSTLASSPPLLPKESLSTLLSSARSETSPSRLAFILFTSGTSSGQPKGCPRRVDSTTHMLEAQSPGLEKDVHERTLVTTANFRAISPLLHLGVWRAGGTAVSFSDGVIFSVEKMLDAIEKFKIKFLVFVPALLYAVILHPAFAKREVGSVKYIVLAGDIITKELILKADKAFPNARATSGHGMTECVGIFVNDYASMSVEEVPFYKEISPLGKAGPGTRLRIRDPDSGETTKRGVPGELCVCSGAAIWNYLNDINADTFFEDEKGRWMRTGDLAIIDNDGVTYILGRIKDVIKRAGIPITPAALEICLQQFIGTQVTVFGNPHPILGQEPIAIGKELNGKTEAEIKNHVLDVFGKDYAIGHYITLEQLKLTSFPVNTTGKIMKLDLLKAVKSLLES